MENAKRLKICCIASLVETVFWIIDLLYMILLVKSDEIIILLGLVFMIVLFAGVAIAFYILWIVVMFMYIVIITKCTAGFNRLRKKYEIK